MSYFARPQEIHRLTLDAYEDERGLDRTGGWVEIKLRRSLADKEAIQLAGLRSTGIKGGISASGTFVIKGDISIDHFDQGAARKEMFRRMIVRWNLQDADGATMPTEDQSYDALDEDLATWLAETLFAYYDARRPSKDAFLNLNGTSTARSSST